MKKITIFELLKKYENWINNDKIQFIQKGSPEKEKILSATN